MSDGNCANFLAMMKQVYDSVCIQSISKGGQFQLDFTLSNVKQTMPLLDEAIKLYYKIGERWWVGFGVSVKMDKLKQYAAKYRDPNSYIYM